MRAQRREAGEEGGGEGRGRLTLLGNLFASVETQDDVCNRED
jgi:hypothetical protein